MGIGYVSSGMMWGAHWGDCLGACPCWKVMSPYGYTLGGGAGDASGFAFGLSTLRGCVRAFCCCHILFFGRGTCGGVAMFNISASFYRAAVYLLPIVVSGIVGAGLRRSWARSESACVVTFSEDIAGNGRVSEENFVVSETCS